MPTNSNEGAMAATMPIQEISLKELATILIKHFEFHEGIYELGVRFNVAIGNVGISADKAGPGAIFTIGGVGISKTNDVGPNTVDAAIVNPVIVKRAAVKRTA